MYFLRQMFGRQIIPHECVLANNKQERDVSTSNNVFQLKKQKNKLPFWPFFLCFELMFKTIVFFMMCHNLLDKMD